ncbi:MAG: hypothetical protein ACE5I2_11255 [Anaerolineae bacterium]
MPVRLPSSFTEVHRIVVRRFVQGKTFSQAERATLFEAFDLLHRAEITTEAGWQSFASVYEQMIEAPFANDYLQGLAEAEGIQAAAEPLRAQVSRQIMPALRKAGLIDPAEPFSFYLLAYCLYWWYAFARGYAFEVEVLRDLEASGVLYQAHDVLDPQARRSPFDLVVLGFRGDIKTSTYFLHATRTQGLPHDFYITRVYEPGEQTRILVVFLKEPAWEAIDGETTPIALDTLAAALPGIFRLQQNDIILIILDYEEWKTRVLRVQKAD